MHPLNKWGAELEIVPQNTGKQYADNDAGRAEQFIDRVRDCVRFVPAWNQWLVWECGYWRPDESGEITRLVVEHSRQLLRECYDILNERDRANAAKAAIAMGNADRIANTLKLAKCDSRIVASHKRLDAEPFLLGVQNGTIELRTGTFREGQRADLITKRAGVEYVAGAQCPRWIAFLREVLRNDAELIAYVQKLTGYTLTGDVSAQLFPFLFGSGKNGKSVFTEVLQKLMGDYAKRAPQNLLTDSINGREPSGEIARLQGARLVIGSETAEGGRLAESRIKDLTGGDTMTGRFLYAESFDFKPCLKLWMFGNHKPEIRGTDEGIWRRVRLVPFTVQIPEERRDPHLTQTLIAELPGILLWAIEGTRRWMAEGLATPRVVSEASAEYRAEEDTLGDFLHDETEEAAGVVTPFPAMYERYCSWAERNGFKRAVLTSRKLVKRLKERGLPCGRRGKAHHWEAISLRQ